MEMISFPAWKLVLYKQMLSIFINFFVGLVLALEED